MSENHHNLSKISYLQQEISQLQGSVKELETLLAYNRDVVKSLGLKLEGNQNLLGVSAMKLAGIEQPLNSGATSTVDRTVSSGGRHLRNIIEHLHTENSKLLEINKKLSDERNVAQSKALINEQIAEAAQRSEAELAQGLHSTICQLKSENRSKDLLIANLEKSRGKIHEDGFQVIYRDTLSLGEQSMKLHNELTHLTDEIVQLKRKNEKDQRRIKNILAVNFSLTQELSRLRKEITISSDGRKTIQGERAPEGLENLEGSENPHKHVLKFHQKLLTRNSNDDDSSSYSADSVGENLPDKVTITDSKGILSKEDKPKALPPKLDLSRAKKLQELQANKAIKQVNNPTVMGSDPKMVEQLHRLERELEASRKLYQHEVTQGKIISEDNHRLQNLAHELLKINEILLRSNKSLNRRRNEENAKLEFYFSFYQRVSALFTDKNLNFFQFLSYGKLNEEIEKFREDNKTHRGFERDRLVHPERDEFNQNPGGLEDREVNISVLEGDQDKHPDGISSRKDKCTFYKNYLIKLAQDLEMNEFLAGMMDAVDLKVNHHARGFTRSASAGHFFDPNSEKNEEEDFEEEERVEEENA